MNTQARINAILGGMKATAPPPLPHAAKATPRNTSTHGTLAMGLTVGILAAGAWLLYKASTTEKEEDAHQLPYKASQVLPGGVA